MSKKTLLAIIALLVGGFSEASANYILTLKNGRRITVQSYREEGGMVKFIGMGGEIGLSKDQIQSIRKAGAEEGSELNLTAKEPPPVGGPDARVAPHESEGREVAADKTPTPEEQRAKEEKEYQESLRSVTEQLQQVRDRYADVTRGTTTKDPTLLTTEEQIQARRDDLIARQKDERQNPTDPGVLRLLTPSPFSSLPPTTTELRAPTPAGPSFATTPETYTDRQRELSDLRNQAIQLEKERERLINEMKQKNFNTGSLFLE
ncbi:MAG TPA: hypothetical protein VNO43_12675 [Candidatus Eisenbacteria bacterium]|nr:hypothetical protein [Candidatus Eisenbacteria bacterium]